MQVQNDNILSQKVKMEKKKKTKKERKVNYKIYALKIFRNQQIRNTNTNC